MWAQFFRFLFGAAVLLLLSACGHRSVDARSPLLMNSDERQIRERIALIREAILAKQAEGIMRHGTPDWTFIAPDGKTFGREAYLERTRSLFQSVTIESLKTEIRYVTVRGDRAELQLSQDMVRTEGDATGQPTRWRVTYQEIQEWVRAADGWHVARVQVFTPKREPLPLR